MKVSVIGSGYVGLSMAVLLSQKHEVVTLDILPDKVDMINKKLSPISDEDIEYYLENKNLNLSATTDYEDCRESDYFIIATPTDYDEKSESFDTDSIECALDNIEKISENATIVIKSTVPIGYTSKIYNKRENINLIYSPEFLREGHSLHDNLYPSRIVVGTPNGNNEEANRFANLLKECSLKDDVEILITGSTEAESIKLFSNSYLAMRISFFNELDSFSEVNGLDTREIIRGVSLDPRIGDYYNNPSFGYGGYCLPKDTMQLRSNYKDIPNSLVSAIVESNRRRKEFIANRISEMFPDFDVTIGVFRLNMKTDSDNSRESSIIHVVGILRERGFEVILYEPTLKDDYYRGCRNIKNLDDFKSVSDIILANRNTDELRDVAEKVYSRDVFNRD
jgi:UDPglucose 6-dehydrogenase